VLAHLQPLSGLPCGKGRKNIFSCQINLEKNIFNHPKIIPIRNPKAADAFTISRLCLDEHFGIIYAERHGSPPAESCCASALNS
jgi:hypothetical protein